MHNTLCQTFYDRCFADTRLTDQTRVVLCPSGKDLYQSEDLLISADHRIQLSFRCQLCHITAVLLQHLCSLLLLTQIFFIQIAIFPHGNKQIDIKLLQGNPHST